MKLMEIYRGLFEGLIQSVDPNVFEGMISVEGDGWSSSSVANVDGYVRVEVSNYDDAISYDVFVKAFNVLKKKASVLGWFPSIMFVNARHWERWDAFSIKETDIDRILQGYDEMVVKIQFEAKYDTELEYSDLPEFIYHVTDKKHVVKIRKIGLTPRGGEKHSNHPARVYFTDDEESILDILPNGMDQFIQEPVFLKIDSSKLQKSFTFYPDPQYQDGFYTYHNIPPNAIEFDVKF